MNDYARACNWRRFIAFSTHRIDGGANTHVALRPERTSSDGSAHEAKILTHSTEGAVYYNFRTLGGVGGVVAIVE